VNKEEADEEGGGREGYTFEAHLWQDEQKIKPRDDQPSPEKLLWGQRTKKENTGAV